MNGVDTSPDAPRSLALAWIGGWLAAIVFALLASLAWAGALASLQGESATLRLLRGTSEVLPGAAIFIGIPALILIAIVALFERGDGRASLGVWLTTAFVVSTPVAFLGWAVSLMGDPIAAASQVGGWTYGVPIFLYSCGLFGAAIACRIRNRSWWA